MSNHRRDRLLVPEIVGGRLVQEVLRATDNQTLLMQPYEECWNHVGRAEDRPLTQFSIPPGIRVIVC